MAAKDPASRSRTNLLPFDAGTEVVLSPAEAYLLPREVPCDTKMHRPKVGRGRAPGRGDGDGGGAEGASFGGTATLNSMDSYEENVEPSVTAALNWDTWCSLSDHRPMVVHFDVYKKKVL